MRASASPVALNPTAMADEGSAVAVAFEEVQSSFDKFCLIAGIEALQELLQEEASVVCGDRYQRHDGRRGRRWGQTKSQVGFHGGRVGVDRPRVRSCEGKQELVLPSWAAAQDEALLSQWAMNQMLITVSTRKFRRSVRLPGGDVGSVPGDGTSKSAVGRRSVEREDAGMVGLRPVGARSAGDPDLHVSDELILVVGIDGRGEKHPLGLVEGATENAATVQALLDNLVERGLDPAGVWLFIIDGAKALSKAIRRTFGKDTPIQRCQVHKARNITERLPKSLHASVRRTLRQAWELDDAVKAERLIRNLARRLEKDWPGISATILEGMEEILCVVRLGLPQDLRRSLACTNIIENMNGTIRQVTRNVKRWRDASMALRWTAAGMMEARKGFRRLKAYKQLPQLRDALLALRTARAATRANHSGLANIGEAA